VYFDESSTDSADGKLRLDQVQVLAEKFDDIYRYETAIFGYEQGGGLPETDPKYGGVDGDPKIQILVQDIDYDFSTVGSTIGYAGSRDIFTQDELDNDNSTYKTNLAEMFYLDALSVDTDPDFAFSMLAHEFQHMIYLNEKQIQKGLDQHGVDQDGADTWYNEMLSLLAEDLISPLIGITLENPGHPVQYRIPYFLSDYRYGLYKVPWDDARYFYETLYPFGAYLVRNFGGVELLMEMAHNNFTGHASVSAALAALNTGMTFDQALSRYGEAIIYSGSHKPEGTASFDKTVSKIVNGTAYAFTGFDIWKMGNPYAEIDLPLGYKGPEICNPRLFTKPMYGHAPTVQSLDEWQRVSGALTIELKKPVNPAIKMWVMVR
jgi:hypothetical protein